MARSYFCLVLHSHIPFVRGAGAWPFGEETIFQVIAESYIPLLNALYDLVEEGHSPHITISFTPILMEQLADPQLLDRFQEYLRGKKKSAQSDARGFQKSKEEQLRFLAEFYAEWYGGLLASFRRRFKRDIIGGFRWLQDAGHIEFITSAATHGYLPLLERDSSIYGQLKVGIETYRRHFRRPPRGVWLPECGYRPPYLKDGVIKPGLADFLNELGLGYFFTDTHALRGGPLLGKAAGDIIGPYASVPKRILLERQPERVSPATTFRPYFVEDTAMAVLARNERTGLQVWSESMGYPGDADYREFHRQASTSGLQYWQITAANTELGQKDLYNPQWAAHRVREHAQHFAGVIAAELAGYASEDGEPGIVVAAYDTELFGHWWFEGMDFLKELIRRLHQHPEVELTTAAAYLERYPPQEAISLPESSWGQGGGHDTWLNPQTEWMWPLIHRAEQWMEELVAAYPVARGRLRQTLGQAARELLLLQASDWPFLVSTGQAQEFAAARFQKHLARFHHLATIAQKGRVDREDSQYLKQVVEGDNPFPEIDYRVFAARESS